MKKITFTHYSKEVTIAIPDDPDYIGTFIAQNHNFYEHPLLRHINKHYPDIKSVVDIGSNLGNHSVFFHDIMGVNEIHAFEPLPELQEILKENIGSFATIHKVALGNKEGSGSMSAYHGNLGASQFVEGGISIPLKTLDSFDLSPDLIKVDAEGMEVAVIEGSLETIKRSRPVLFVEHMDLENLYKTSRLLTPLNYQLRVFNTPTWEMFEYIPK